MLNAMRGRRSPWIAAGAFAILMIMGCGAGAGVRKASLANRIDSARYCQERENGAWVTNDSDFSTTPCVPDPSYATGNRIADGAGAIPRCFTCKLADWTRAEQRKALPPAPPDDTSSGDADSATEWSSGLRYQIVGTCTSSWGGSSTLCDCLVNHVALQIPASQASSLSPDDMGVQAAIRACDPAAPDP